MTFDILEALVRLTENNRAIIVKKKIDEIQPKMTDAMHNILSKMYVNTDNGDYSINIQDEKDVDPDSYFKAQMKTLYDKEFAAIKVGWLKDELYNYTESLEKKLFDFYKKNKFDILERHQIQDLSGLANSIINNDIKTNESSENIKKKIFSLINNSSITIDRKQNLIESILPNFYRNYIINIANNEPEKILNNSIPELARLDQRTYSHIIKHANACISSKKAELSSLILDFKKNADHGYYDLSLMDKISSHKYYNEEVKTEFENIVKISDAKSRIMMESDQIKVNTIIDQYPEEYKKELNKFNSDIVKKRINDPREFASDYIKTYKLPITKEEDIISLQKELGCREQRFTTNEQCYTYAEFFLGSWRDGEIGHHIASLTSQKGIKFIEEIMSNEIFDNEKYFKIKIFYNTMVNCGDFSKADSFLKIQKDVEEARPLINALSAAEKKDIKKRCEKKLKDFIDQHDLYYKGFTSKNSQLLLDSICETAYFNKIKKNNHNRIAANDAFNLYISDTYNKFGDIYFPKKIRDREENLIELNPVEAYKLFHFNRPLLDSIVKEEQKKTFPHNEDLFNDMYDLNAVNRIYKPIINNGYMFYMFYNKHNPENRYLVIKDGEPVKHRVDRL